MKSKNFKKILSASIASLTMLSTLSGSVSTKIYASSASQEIGTMLPYHNDTESKILSVPYGRCICHIHYEKLNDEEKEQFLELFTSKNMIDYLKSLEIPRENRLKEFDITFSKVTLSAINHSNFDRYSDYIYSKDLNTCCNIKEKNAKKLLINHFNKASEEILQKRRNFHLGEIERTLYYIESQVLSAAERKPLKDEPRKGDVYEIVSENDIRESDALFSTMKNQLPQLDESEKKFDYLITKLYHALEENRLSKDEEKKAKYLCATICSALERLKDTYSTIEEEE